MDRKGNGIGRPNGPSPLQFLGIGFDLVVPLLLGLFGGRWLDRHLGTAPWLTLLGAALGGVAGTLSLIRRVSSQDGGPGGGKR